ncbi:MAG: inositol monophosphatase [Desulfobacteraceae bacterium]|nr:inositol monophosphatase [Desulfobacteraceae bacterium]
MDKVHEILEKAAKKAADSILTKRRDGFSIRKKPCKDLVTDCDIASEKAIISVLQKAFPGSAFHSEECGYQEGEGWLWIIDPIDGTHNFIFGLSYYGISIAGIREGRFIVGLIYFPETKDCFFAYKNKGAYMNGKKIGVSSREKLEQSMIAYDNQFHNSPLMLKNLKPVVDSCFTIRILGSAAMDLCKVADGTLDARILHKPKLVDLAAGIIIVEEAGGRVTDIKGENVMLTTTSIVASNGLIHQSLLNILVEG